MNNWINSSVFYHIYPLGFCGAPAHNDFSSAPISRLDKVYGWLDHIQSLGANALYLGPLFESSTHGYDTADYFWVDRRLGTNDTLKALSAEIHRRGMRLVLDGVFNHCGRDFWAFKDVRQKGQASPFVSWFQNLRFDQSSPYGDPFSYEGWNGYLDMVKFNLANPDVRNHLFEAVTSWVRDYDVDGLRLDAADCVDLAFWQAFSIHCHTLKPDFWLMGEVVHGDYKKWVNPEHLDSVTNYECYKGLYSSLNDANYFEISYALERQFGSRGIYRGLSLYNFVDNHDVDRVASLLKDPSDLYPLYLMLFSMPGIPSLYYGSEWGIEGKRLPHTDAPVRPDLDLGALINHNPHPEMPALINRLVTLRRQLPALTEGGYQALRTESRQMAFLRQVGNENVFVALNSAPNQVDFEIKCPFDHGTLQDYLNPGENFEIRQGKVSLPLSPHWGRILKMVP